MSKSIGIKEGGAARLFGGTNYLKTETAEGSACLWVPEDDRKLSTKYITKNGAYQAAKDGVYGWGSVQVSVISNSVTGKDPTTGKTVSVSANPDTGELEETVVPTEIRFTTPPTKTVYRDGEAIGLVGATITAYDSDGNELKTVPLNEVTIYPTTASYDASSDYRTADGELETGLEMPFPFSNTLTRVEERELAIITDTLSCAAVTSYGESSFVAASATKGQASSTHRIVYNDGREPIVYESTIPLEKSFTHDGKTVYYYDNFNGTWDSQTPHANTSGNIAVERIAWTMIYGDTTMQGSHQTITVSWPRSDDGVVLETSFAITVTAPGFDGAEGGGGSTSGGGAGRG